MSLFEIKHRFSGAVLFSLETKNMGMCVEAAIKSGSNLRDSDLRGSNLSYSDLRGSNLSYSDLSYSDLRGSNLSYSDLRGSNLRYSNLSYSDLSYSDLNGSDLRDSNLRGAKIRDNITVTKSPIQIYGLCWPIIIWDAHMQIGCEFHSHDEWAAFTEADWIRMGGKQAALMLRNEYPAIKLLCERHAVKSEQEAA